MNPEERFVDAGIEVGIEFPVILVGQVGRFASPGRLQVVDDFVFVGIDIFAVFPLLLFTEYNGYGQEAAILLQQRLDALLFEELLVLIVDIQHNIGTAFALVDVGHLVGRRTVAAPHDTFCPLFIGQGANLNLLRNHEGGVEAQAEVADDGVGIVFIFLQKLFSTRKGNLVDIFVYLFGRHAYTVVGDGKRAGLLVDRNRYVHRTQLAFEVAKRCQSLQFLRSIDGIRYQLSQKYFVIAVQKLFDNGEDVVGCNPDSTFLHGYMVFIVTIFHSKFFQKKCQTQKV